MGTDTLALLVLYMLIAIACLAIISASALIGRARAPDARRTSYECGCDQASPSKKRFPVKFFLVAMIFIVFDVEIALLFPWAVAFRRAQAEGYGYALLLEVSVFLALLGLALVYVWGRGALKWEE